MKGMKLLQEKTIKKWGNSNSTYVLLKDFHVVYLGSHWVRAMNFLMPAKSHCVFCNDSLYELPSDAVTRIRFVITTLNDVD